MRSNTYVLLFTALVTVILGFLLSVTYSQLKELQEQNVAVDMRKNILSSTSIRRLRASAAKWKRIGLPEILSVRE